MEYEFDLCVSPNTAEFMAPISSSNFSKEQLKEDPKISQKHKPNPTLINTLKFIRTYKVFIEILPKFECEFER